MTDGNRQEPAAHSPFDSLRPLVAALLVCAAYYGSGLIAIRLRFEPGNISAIWLPHGILVAALLLSRMRRWWLVLALLLPTHVHLVLTFQRPEPPLPVVLGQYAGNVASAALAAAVLRRFLGQPPWPNTLSRMSALIVVAGLIAPCLASAPTVWLFTMLGWVQDFSVAWQRRTFTGMCGAVVVLPAILHLASGGLSAARRASARQVAEYLLLTAGLLAALVAVFRGDFPGAARLWLPFTPLPLLLWSALRFGAAGLGPHLLAVAFLAFSSSQAGRGPFVTHSPAETVLALQGFFLLMSIPALLLAAMVQEHAQATAALRDSQKQYRSVVEDQTELICRFLPDGTYTFVNGAYCRYFERSAEQLLGQDFWQFIPVAAHAEGKAHLASLTPERPVATIEHEVLTPSGEVRWQQWTDRAFFDQQGRVVDYQSVGRDITERIRAEDERRELRGQAQVAEALREVDRRKDEFLAMLGHELRNPLAPITTAVELMQTRDIADATIVLARDVIDRQTSQLTRLVDDLLDVSRITRGKIKLDLQPLDLRLAIAQAIEATRPSLIARHHELTVDLPDQPLSVEGDAVRLTQVVSNLLGNAARYTDEGGRITLSARQLGSEVMLRVSDNGVGIPTDMLDRVFDAFTQVDRPGKRGQGGLGIGLALVKQLVEMHRGAVQARSDGPGRGSEFLVRLPLALDQTVAADADLATPASATAWRKRVLVVDDNVDAAQTLSELLRLHQHEVVVAHDGLAALAAARSMTPDVILLDIGLPKLDGLSVARRLRQDLRGARPLLVATTGFGQPEDLIRTSAAGFDHHMTKPVDPGVLLALVGRSPGSRG